MTRIAHPPPVSEQVGVGFVVAAVGALAEIGVALARPGVEAGAADWVRATLHLLSFELPVGVAVGACVGLALWALRGTAFAEPLRLRAASPKRLFAHDAEGFAGGVGLLVAAAAYLGVARVAAEHFATRYHAPDLAAWVMAGTALALVVVAAFVASVVAATLRPLARRAGRVASTGVVLVLGAALLITAAVVFAVAHPLLFDAYDPVALGWAPGLAALYLLVAWLVRRRLRRGTPARRVRSAAALCVAVAAIGLGWTAHSYGHSNVVRSLLEQRTVTGLRLVRGYMQATDRDGDGHSFAFGGGDCNDSDPSVFPGAVDVPGDGVDSDCFAGDGSPEVADLGDGRYGEVPGLKRPNILLVTIDALRASHLGAYGYDRPTSPNLDAFAAKEVQFDPVIAQSSRSIRSIPAMMTGLYPSQIAYGDEYLFPALLPENVTVAEALRDAGYRTAVIMGTDYFERVGNFFQGFQDVGQINIYRPPRPMPVSRALVELSRLQRDPHPWFLWVHLFNVHEEYLWDHVPSKFGDTPMDAYDTEITFADREVGRLLDAVKRRKLMDDTAIVITADHGEAFGEHGNHGHSTTLYEEELHVPLLVHVPGVKPRRVRGPVALFDVMPTLLNLAGVPVPRPMPARSLVPLLTGKAKASPDRLLFSEILPDGLYPYDQKAIRKDGMKLIWWVREGTYQLYDLHEDPGERHDLSDERPDTAKRLLGLLRAWVAQTNRPEQRDRDVISNNRLDHAPARLTRRIDARFPGFTLLGFDMPKQSFRPGDRIAMTFYYRVDAPIDDNYFFFVDIKGPPGYRVPPHFHAHHFPMNGRYRTYEWHTGEILRDPVEMIVPEDIRRPVTLKIDLTVLDKRRAAVPFEGPKGEKGYTVDLAEAHVN